MGGPAPEASKPGETPGRVAPPAAARGVPVSAAIVVAACLVGLAARGVCVILAPQYSYPWDHTCNLAWGDYALQHGPQKLYEYDRDPLFLVEFPDPRTGERKPIAWRNAHVYNYPPGSAFLFWFKGWLWNLLEPQQTTVKLGPRDRERLNVTTDRVTARVSNTTKARLVSAVPAVTFDFLLAWGVLYLVRILSGARASPVREAIAFALVLLAPPIFLDSAFWGQADSWIMAILVWCLAALLRGRFWLAGALLGLAITIKPQAILLAPVLVFIAASLRFVAGGSWGSALRLWKTGVAAAAVALLISAPFMLNDARDPGNSDGPLRWFKRSYLGTIGDERYDRVTLNAFNAWWLHLAARYGEPGSLEASAAPWGIRNDWLGRAALIAAVGLTWFLCARKWRWARESWLACTFLVMLAAFALPTRVHERYIYYCLPFAIALASLRPLVWGAPLAALLVVGTAEMVSFRWVSMNDAADRAAGVVLAALVLATLVYSWLVLLPRERAAGAATAHRPSG